MGRKLRQTEAGIYHVAARAQVGELLFRDEHDYLRFETEVEQIVSPACTCIAACAIDTHYHLLLQTEDGVINRAMQRLNHAYSRAFNARCGRRGHTFADRYVSVPVTSEGHLLTVFRYIARNPVEAGLCSNPAHWVWSSYREAIGRRGRFAFADPSAVLDLFSGSTDKLRRVRGDAVGKRPNSGVRHRFAVSDTGRGGCRTPAGCPTPLFTSGARPPAAPRSSPRV